MPEDIIYNAEPTAAKLHACDSFVSGILGPIGSGKTVACCLNIVAKAVKEKVYRRGKKGKPIRYSRWALIRNTQPELETTTIKTWLDWWEDYTVMNWAKPVTGVFTMPVGDGTTCQIELIFLALDKPKDVKKLRGLELTGVFINEATEVPYAAFEMARGRVNRYPSKRRGGPNWTGVLMDTNPPDDDHFYYKYAEESRPEGWTFFKQPPALLRTTEDKLDELPEFVDEPSMEDGTLIIKHRPLAKNQEECDRMKEAGESPLKIAKAVDGSYYYPNPEAENIRHQPAGYSYYLMQVPGASMEFIKVFLRGQYGTLTDGTPVYPEYQDHIHCAAEEFGPIPGVGITLGWDAGLTPAVSMSQITPLGQKRIFDELLVVEHASMGLRQFSQTVVVPYLLKKYPEFVEKKLFTSYSDPAMSIRSQNDEVTGLMILNQKGRNGKKSLRDIGIKTKPARTNSPIARQDAVKSYLISEVDDGVPGFLLSPRCKYLRKGFRGGYVFERVQVSGDEKYKDAPKKDHSSHIQDGLQYDCLMSSYISFVDEDTLRERATQAIFEDLDSTSRIASLEIKETRERLEQNDLGFW